MAQCTGIMGSKGRAALYHARCGQELQRLLHGGGPGQQEVENPPGDDDPLAIGVEDVLEVCGAVVAADVITGAAAGSAPLLVRLLVNALREFQGRDSRTL